MFGTVQKRAGVANLRGAIPGLRAEIAPKPLCGRGSPPQGTVERLEQGEEFAKRSDFPHQLSWARSKTAADEQPHDK